MAESVIQRRVSDPEFTTQTVAANVSLESRSGSVTATLTSATNVSSVSITSSSIAQFSALTFNVAKSGYTLVGITTIPASTTGITNSSVAYASLGTGTSEVTKHASVTVSGNTIVASFGSATLGNTSNTAYLKSITCKYVKNN